MDYIKSVEDIDDLEERARALSEYLDRIESEGPVEVLMDEDKTTSPGE